MKTRPFSASLQSKIDSFVSLKQKTLLGDIQCSSKLLLAPMAGICTAPFRLLMEDLGAGMTVSELISATGIKHKNLRTLDMLRIDSRENNIGIQLFGETLEDLILGCKAAQSAGAKFIDLNMGCPVKKVVQKGAGSALMKNISELPSVFKSMKDAVTVPVSIKIRTGWDQDQINAHEIEKIAANEGIEWVAIHGRTRAQQYTGLADWDYIEEVAKNASVPVIGNGDLHQPFQVKERLRKTGCNALMIARGCLRNPFIFLESLPENLNNESQFFGRDYWEVIQRLYDYTIAFYDNERTRLVQLRKLIVWFAAGFYGAASFREKAFKSADLDSTMRVTESFFLSLEDRRKKINYSETFMNSGHG